MVFRSKTPIKSALNTISSIMSNSLHNMTHSQHTIIRAVHWTSKFYPKEYSGSLNFRDTQFAYEHAISIKAAFSFFLEFWRNSGIPGADFDSTKSKAFFFHRVLNQNFGFSKFLEEHHRRCSRSAEHVESTHCQLIELQCSFDRMLSHSLCQTVIGRLPNRCPGRMQKVNGKAEL